MSLLEIKSRANYLVYNYIKKELLHDALAEDFKRREESASTSNWVVFKGLEDLTTILQKYYRNSCTVEEGTKTATDQPESNGKCKPEKKRRKKQVDTTPSSEDGSSEQVNEANPPVPQVDPSTERGDEANHQEPSESHCSQAEKKKRKKKRHLEVEPESELQVTAEQALVESNGGSVASTAVEVGHDSSRKRRKKHQTAILGDECSAAEESAANLGTEVVATKAEADTGPKKKRKKQKAEAVSEAVTVADTAEETAAAVSVTEKTEAGRPDEDAGVDGSVEGAEKKSSKHQKRHNQPFRRVREEEVVNKHFQDNSFDAKPGASNGWGYKANEDLKPTQGRSFRHEKTKKKRGSYKGGAIDTGVSSFKFESDSE